MRTKTTTYEVKVINSVTKHSEVLKSVVADGLIETMPFRWFVTKEGERFEFPMKDHVFWFSSGRQKLFQEGQK